MLYINQGTKQKTQKAQILQEQSPIPLSALAIQAADPFGREPLKPTCSQWSVGQDIYIYELL